MKTFAAFLAGLVMFSAVGCDAASVEIGNKICPVSGGEVGSMGDVVKYEHNGKAYNLCCKMCEKDFSKDPDKYSKIAEDEVAAGQDAHAGHQH